MGVSGAGEAVRASLLTREFNKVSHPVESGLFPAVAPAKENPVTLTGNLN